jgi:hypothetical protein
MKEGMVIARLGMATWYRKGNPTYWESSGNGLILLAQRYSCNKPIVLTASTHFANVAFTVGFEPREEV